MSTKTGKRNLKVRKIAATPGKVYSDDERNLSGARLVKERSKAATQVNKIRKTVVKPPTPKYLAWIKRFPLRPIESEEQNDFALTIFGELMKLNIAKKLTPDEIAYYDVISKLIGEFEDKTYNLGPEPTGAEMLEFLMEQHNLRQVDLVKELGSQTTVSFILTGKRKLTSSQIDKLAKRFKVSPAIFHDNSLGKRR